MIGYRYFREAKCRKIVKSKISTLLETYNEGILFENEKLCKINLQGNVESILELDKKQDEINIIFDLYVENKINRNRFIQRIKDLTDIDVEIGR